MPNTRLHLIPEPSTNPATYLCLMSDVDALKEGAYAVEMDIGGKVNPLG